MAAANETPYFVDQATGNADKDIVLLAAQGMLVVFDIQKPMSRDKYPFLAWKTLPARGDGSVGCTLPYSDFVSIAAAALLAGRLTT